MLDLLTLPFRLFFGIVFGLLALPFALLAIPFALLFLPFLLLRVFIKTAVALVMLPVVLLAVVIGIGATLFAVALAVALPLLADRLSRLLRVGHREALYTTESGNRVVRPHFRAASAARD